MKKASAAFLSLTIVLAGCATASKNIAANQVSPLQYQTYDCEQLTSETLRIQSKTNALAGRLDEAAANDQAIATAGGLLFWPALFFLGGTKQQETEYAQLKGEYDAVQQVSISKKCLPAS